jgi:hypothetical protein
VHDGGGGGALVYTGRLRSAADAVEIAAISIADESRRAFFI